MKVKKGNGQQKVVRNDAEDAQGQGLKKSR